MISYADLERAYRLERGTPTLQKLRDGFYEDARRLASMPEAADYRENISQYIREIYCLRANKIIHYAGRASAESKPPDNILQDELMLYDRILECVAENRAYVLERPLEAAAESRVKMVRVRLKKAIPAIVGSDSKEYGPFKEDDVADLPDESAKLLLSRGFAEKA